MNKSQNNLNINNIRKRKSFGIYSNNQIYNIKNNNNTEKNAYSVDNTNNQMKVHQGILFYLEDNKSAKKNTQKKSLNNLINDKDINNIKNTIKNNNILLIDKPKKHIQKSKNENKEKDKIKEKVKDKENEKEIDKKILICLILK